MKKTYKRLLWLRHETKPFEERAPITPAACRTLIKLGHKVAVESSKGRIFSDAEYGEAGCEIVKPGSWVTAPTDAFILGLKELPNENFPLNHRHIYFAHAFKGQAGARDLLKRFVIGGGKLYDLEYLVDKNKKRVVAFGHWAGFTGAALALKVWAFKKLNLNVDDIAPLMPFSSSEDLIEKVGGFLDLAGDKPKVLILGHKGRSGRGAKALCRQLGIEFEGWGRAETKQNSDPKNLLSYDILVNTVLINKATKAFLTPDCIKQEKRLSVISDVSCDPTGPYNPLPIYKDCTTMQKPSIKIADNLELIAIDHLPSLLPKESSSDFSSALLPFLIDLLQAEIEDTAWERSLTRFYEEVEEYQIFDPISPIMAESESGPGLNLH
ncbi:MAG: saccharopine dehydrogenase [Halobacteriovorax sp.]|nr:saccharopine dehydrogenase [Halobacteriovorax sp.]|tara:strand:+ start:40019 stop:41161 length:1143 start_codon:yes stop_codon:yes gene_type:complete